MTEPTRPSELRLPALQVKQSLNRALYSFAVDGKLISQFATVSRITREGSDVQGYQRPEVLSHIAEIRDYLESGDPMIPNSVVIAFGTSVRFEPTSEDQGEFPVFGTLVIPLDPGSAPETKPGFIVDGQQRLAAIRDAAIPSFPVFATAFITDDAAMQTEQFILVNSAKPLPKGLIYELLPSTEGHLPTLLRRRRLPAYLVQRLNHDPESPFKGRIQTPTNPQGVVKDNSLLRMIENSLTDGALYRYRDDGSGEPATESMLALIKAYWLAVSQVFHDAWGLPPKRSRLMHGAGIISLGFIMDAVADRCRDTVPSESHFEQELRHLTAVCRWTDGYWDFGPGLQRKWNDIQNTPRDVQILANFLISQYRIRDRVSPT